VHFAARTHAHVLSEPDTFRTQKLNSDVDFFGATEGNFLLHSPGLYFKIYFKIMQYVIGYTHQMAQPISMDATS
jgi:hypothetical protein